jgi:hypothetical protein
MDACAASLDRAFTGISVAAPGLPRVAAVELGNQRQRGVAPLSPRRTAIGLGRREANATRTVLLSPALSSLGGGEGEAAAFRTVLSLIQRRCSIGSPPGIKSTRLAAIPNNQRRISHRHRWKPRGQAARWIALRLRRLRGPYRGHRTDWERARSIAGLRTTRHPR